MENIAIIGVTGYVGRSLVRECIDRAEYKVLHLFGRDIENIHSTLRDIGLPHIPSSVFIHHIDEFVNFEYDCVINASGVGDPLSLSKNPHVVFLATEQVDSMILEYQKEHASLLYINISSGACYGSDFSKALSESSLSVLHLENPGVFEYYSVAKMNSELKHRSLGEGRWIVDIRLFTFFSRYVPHDSSFLLSQIARSVVASEEFTTTHVDLVRDVVSSRELYQFVLCVSKASPRNCCLDIRSSKPLTKFELLQELQSKFKLKLKYSEAGSPVVPTKNVYYSESNKFESIEYVPLRTSLEVVSEELFGLLEDKGIRI
jgi:nucleoside-diphosphate-sugar epimerase